MKRRYKLLPFVIVLPLLVYALAGARPEQNSDYYSRITSKLARELPREHLSRRELNEEIVKQTIHNYIASLDFDRIYFLDSDIQHFKARAETLKQELRDGDNSFAFEVFDTFKERMQDRIAFVDELLEEEFDFGVEEEYRWKRREAPWSEDQEDWDELWRKRIKNEYLRRILQDNNENASTNGPNAVVEDAENVEEDSTSSQEEATDDAKEDTDDVDDAEEAYIPPYLEPDEYIRNRYRQYRHVMEDADDEWILQKYLSSFARAFDPHCDYMFPAAVEDFEIEMKLSLVGIGAVLRPEDGAARVVSLIPGGPASKDTRDRRLRPGDKIIAVAEEDEEPQSILHWPLYRSVRLIRGEKGTKVRLTVIPASDPSGVTTKEVDLVRDEIKLEEREARSDIHSIPDPDGATKQIGVITVPTFYADMEGRNASPDATSVSRDVANILRDMRREDVDAVVLDLRNNGGGSLIEAILMTGLFMESGPVVQVRESTSVSVIPNNDPTIAFSGPLAVLVNRVSASASEIVAAALQDYGRAIILGDSKTHGKGSVQTVKPLGRSDDSGSMKVTSALFYRITGESTQLRGVEPDIVIPSAFDASEFGEEFLDNPLEWNTVQPTMYSTFDDLAETIPTLRQKSETRREEDPRFEAYLEMLDRIRSMNESENITLHKETRREQQRIERELNEIQNQLMDQAGITDTDEDEEEEDHEFSDLVKDEAINIMADWLNLRNQESTEQESDAS